ncbi:hypothetical protein Cni_G23207 [Canna indica]|uniref:Uncharacterized protein n=1 Tax=Canna indica TaxID=4628 RepID=A0AAQ3KSQ2_9LILI|nr:hypothetical protein Cni_G23207 [Canna indica]
MAVPLLQFIFWVIGSLLSLLCFIVFRGVALLLVALIQLLKLPRQVSAGAIDFFSEVLRSILEYALDMIKNVTLAAVSGFFEALKSAATGSIQLSSAAAAELVERTRSGLGELSEMLPKVVEAAAEMVVKAVDGLWNSYKDAVGYIMENA